MKYVAGIAAFIAIVTLFMYGIGELLMGVSIWNQFLTIGALFAGISIATALTIILPVVVGLIGIGLAIYWRQKIFHGFRAVFQFITSWNSPVAADDRKPLLDQDSAPVREGKAELTVDQSIAANISQEMREK